MIGGLGRDARPHHSTSKIVDACWHPCGETMRPGGQQTLIYLSCAAHWSHCELRGVEQEDHSHSSAAHV
jgi:hypothetical protein